MTDLTEKWKKGELPDGWYYVQLKEGVYADNVKSIIMDYYTEFSDFMKHPYLIEQVLAPVPSYDEWQASEKYNKHLEEVIKIYERKDKQATETSIAYNELAEENTKLKELLKECKDEIDYLRKHYKGNIDHFKNNTRLDKEINQALGEDK